MEDMEHLGLKRPQYYRKDKKLTTANYQEHGKVRELSKLSNPIS